MTTHVERFNRAPVHPALIAFTVGTLAASLLLDLMTRLMTDGSMSLVNLSYRLVGFGILGGLALATISALDLRRIPQDSSEIDSALLRLAIDLAVVLLFIVNFFWRELTAFNTETTVGQILLSLVAVAALIGGFARHMTARNARA